MVVQLANSGNRNRNRKANAMPSGGGGGGWAKMNESMAANRAKLQANAPKPGLLGYGSLKPQYTGNGGNLPMTSMPAGLTHGEIPNYDGAERTVTGTSIFDPVLCELAYRWFCPPGGLVLDPFAGGSVRGIVAAKCGRRYIGIDLSERQVAANRAQAETICKNDGNYAIPMWCPGDAADLAAIDCAADFVFSCPPYGDLEVYSDNPADLSTMADAAFIVAYHEIIAAAVDKLKEDRFACFVVGDYRDKRGFYRNFPGETIGAFAAAGAGLYNEAILVTAAGSLPIRAGKQFSSSRKLGKTHQNVLVFRKGDPRKATEACGSVAWRGGRESYDPAAT
jgi:hypothetical protein